jgi:hypothetical protein
LNKYKYVVIKIAIYLEVFEINNNQTDFVSEIIGQINIGKNTNGVFDDNTNYPFNNFILIIDIGYKKL